MGDQKDQLRRYQVQSEQTRGGEGKRRLWASSLSSRATGFRCSPPAGSMPLPFWLASVDTWATDVNNCALTGSCQGVAAY